MKRFLMILLLALMMALAMCPVCLAAEGSMGGDMSYEEQEALVRDILDTLLERGDEQFAGQEWWEVLASWVRSNLGAIVAGLGGVFALVGFVVVNPKLRSYVSSLGSSCKGWFEKIAASLERLLTGFKDIKGALEAYTRAAERQTRSNMLIVDTLEDVIKLSGADESKKDIYIAKIETAKKTFYEATTGGEIGDGSNHEE